MSKKEYQKISVDYAKSQIQYWEKVISVLEKCTPSPTDSLPTKIFKLYANLQNVGDIAKILKNEGITNQATQTAYTSTEITALIKKSTIEDKDIEQFVKSIQSKNIKTAKHHM